MVRPARRRSGPPVQAAHALVLDREGLSRAATGNQRAAAWIARARELRLPLAVNAVTLTETLRGGGRDAPIHLLTRNAQIDTVDSSFAAEAGRLLGRTRRDDTVDALVATTAIGLARPAVILTSDPDDLSALTAEHRQIRVLAV